MSVFTQIKKTKESLTKKVSPFLTPPPVANPVATSTDAGKSSISITKDIDPNVPENNSKDTSARKEGLELYMQEKRGARGGRLSKGGSRKGLVYTEGKFKGMTEGQADAIELKEYREMKPQDRDKYNVVSEGDYETGKKRSIEMEKIASETARENERLAKGGAPKTESSSPSSTSTPPPVSNPSAPQTNRERGMGSSMDSAYSGKKEPTRVSKPLDQLPAQASNKSEPASTFQKPTANSPSPVSNPAPLTPQPMRKPESSPIDRALAEGASKMKADEAAAKKKANDDAILAPMRAERAAKEQAEIDRKKQIATNTSIKTSTPDTSSAPALGQKMMTGANNNASYGNDKGATLDYISGRGATPPPVAKVGMDDGSKQDFGSSAMKPLPQKPLIQAIAEDAANTASLGAKAVGNTAVKAATEISKASTNTAAGVPSEIASNAAKVGDTVMKSAEVAKNTGAAINSNVVSPVVNAAKESVVKDVNTAKDVAKTTAALIPGQTGKTLKKKAEEL